MQRTRKRCLIFTVSIRYEFITASGLYIESNDILTADNIEKYLVLMLQHESLRDSVNEVTHATILEQITKSVNFDETDKRGMGSAGGVLAKIYVDAY